MNLQEFNQKVEELEARKDKLQETIDRLEQEEYSLEEEISDLTNEFVNSIDWNTYCNRPFKAEYRNGSIIIFFSQAVDEDYLSGFSIYIMPDDRIKYETTYYVTKESVALNEWEEIDKEEYITYLNKLKEHVNGI